MADTKEEPTRPSPFYIRTPGQNPEITFSSFADGPTKTTEILRSFPTAYGYCTVVHHTRGASGLPSPTYYMGPKNNYTGKQQPTPVKVGAVILKMRVNTPLFEIAVPQTELRFVFQKVNVVTAPSFHSSLDAGPPSATEGIQIIPFHVNEKLGTLKTKLSSLDLTQPTYLTISGKAVARVYRTPETPKERRNFVPTDMESMGRMIGYIKSGMIRYINQSFLLVDESDLDHAELDHNFVSLADCVRCGTLRLASSRPVCVVTLLQPTGLLQLPKPEQSP